MSGVFISYRHSDAKQAAVRIRNHLADAFGEDHVFIDTALEAEADASADLLARHLATASVVVAVVGPDWLAADSDGRARLLDPDDYLRFELQAAIDRGLPIVPAFVNGACGLPGLESLPAAIERMADHQGLQLRMDRFELDVRELESMIEPLVKKAALAPSADDLKNPALGFTAITLLNGRELGPFEALKLQTTYEAIKRGLGAVSPMGSLAGYDRAFLDVLSPLVDHGRFQLTPRIAPLLEKAARQACRIKPYQRTLAAVDLSFFRWGRSGIVVTDDGLFRFGDATETTFVSNGELAEQQIELAGSESVRVGTTVLTVPRRVDAHRVLDFVRAVASVARYELPAHRKPRLVVR